MKKLTPRQIAEKAHDLFEADYITSNHAGMIYRRGHEGERRVAASIWWTLKAMSAASGIREGKKAISAGWSDCPPPDSAPLTVFRQKPDGTWAEWKVVA